MLLMKMFKYGIEKTFQITIHIYHGLWKIYLVQSRKTMCPSGSENFVYKYIVETKNLPALGLSQFLAFLIRFLLRNSGPYLYIHSDLDQCILKFYLSLIYPTLNPSGKYFWWQFCLLAKTRNCFDKSFVKWDK